MKTVQIVFSPTGGTQRVVDIITDEWNIPVERIDLTDAGMEFADLDLAEDAVAVIAVPSYGGRVPALAAQRLAKIRGNERPCILVCVYGNRLYEDTLIELNDVAEQSGFRVIAAISAVAEHSIMHQYATGRPDEEDKKELQGFAGRILEKIQTGCDSTIEIPGNRPYRKAGGVGLVPLANDKCTQCGLCAQNCPAGAIDPENARATDKKKCISCMRCVVQCPESARTINDTLVSVVALAIKKECSKRKNNELMI